MTSATVVLGIESSCDETAAAVVRGGREVLSSVVHSQIAEHAVWGGVVPEIAGRGHLAKIAPTIQEAMAGAGIGPESLDAIAVTSRPGLLGSLLVGVTAAKALAWAWGKPLVDVHHIEAHAYAALMSLESWEFPYVTLIVSGGHTSLYRTDSPLAHELLGATIDDAAGEALDKGAAMLGLPYPGGPSIERAGADGDPRAYAFKQPMLGPDSLDFSFSGMKTALLYKLKGAGGRREDPTLPEARDLAGMAASFEHAVVETLARKCLRACERTGIPRLLVGGGVGRNRRLRARLGERAAAAGVEVAFARPEHCTDNAVMVAGLGCARFEAGLLADLDLDVAAR
ncbi:MAG: tRNA (adenosine(37)-N6)-threonylcarbamoyltransferase complex transferase subunit TsaD [Planctomycetota bacterium]|nr:MAG: tRNA (adenosine(37)-N6)-threonylcarbamoyltransferase complex transferase subunit TsaD [Planctomycetota bacterium]